MHAEKVTLTRGDASITLVGVDDENYEGVLHSPEQLRELAGTDGFTILLSHRPEYFWRYAESGIDLTLSGHAHGGQFRLPLIVGLYAPGQGAFPAYDSGVYTYQNANMVVSRGIGQSSFPLRFNNRPELVIITLVGTD
jgi:predicted MPP superfamily phosphohydrolase